MPWNRNWLIFLSFIFIIMRCKKHKPIWMFPFLADVPKEKKVDFFVLSISSPMDYAICEHCGLIAHQIKSRRGGFRWHTNSDDTTNQKRILQAIEFWKKMDLPVPPVLSFFACS